MNHLKEVAAEFSKAHPALAPMLSGPSTDPDVERLLEGVAFLVALLRQKLDDEFPEIIHELMHMIWPHYLRPVPSTTIMAFSPKPTLKQSLSIPRGVSIASIPVEGTSCLFQTCYEVEVHPLNLLEASFLQPPGRPPMMKLVLELRGLRLSDWQPKCLRFFFSGNHTLATDLYFLLRHQVRRIMINPLEKGASSLLGPDFLKPVGYGPREALIPYPSNSFPGYRILQEYFILPEKFLFLDLIGWERWQKRGDGSRFEICFELAEISSPPPRIKKDNFVLFATPAVNVFPHEADPVRLNHHQAQYLVRPSGSNAGHYQVYAVEKVVGFMQGTAEERRYFPFDLFHPQSQKNPVYHLNFTKSPVDDNHMVYLSVAYPPEAGPPLQETLSIGLLCTNGSLPEGIQSGDVSLPTGSSPEFVEFKNLRPPTPASLPPLGTNLLWRLVSHLSLNHLSLTSAENLRALLTLYLFPASRDRTAILANEKRIAGIEKIEVKPANRLVSGLVMRGQEVKVKMRQDHFAGQGDLYLLGCILDYFLGGYASINTYTNLVIEEITKGDLYQWSARIGDRPLI
ncbi:MAG: type VI secretion system baseplate subunit TssF [bacterium]